MINRTSCYRCFGLLECIDLAEIVLTRYLIGLGMSFSRHFVNKISFVLFILSLFRNAVAQIDTISLSESIELALKQNANVHVSQNAVDQSDARLHELKTNRYPSLSFRTHFLYAPDFGYNVAITNGGEYGVQLMTGLPLYDGGVKNALVDQAVSNLARTQLDKERMKSEITFSIRSAYYEILRSEAELHIRQETVRRLQDYVSLLKQLQSGGGATESDVLNAQVDLNNAEIALDGTQESIRNAKLLLNNLMGRSLHHQFEVIQLPSADSTAISDSLPANNVDLRLLQYDVEAAVYDIAIAKSERLPTLAISGDIGALGIMVRDWRHETGYSVLLSLDIPIFTWGGIDSRIEQKELSQKQKQLELDVKRRDLETQWQLTINDVEQFKRNFVQYMTNLRIANDNYLYAKARFVGGGGSNLDVLEAQRLLLETQLNANNSEFQLRSAIANLLRLSGQY